MNYSTSEQIKAAIERSFTSFKTNLDTIYNTTYSIITIPNHEPIKVIYVRMVKEIVEAEEANKKKED